MADSPIPVKTDLTVISADPLETKPLGFTVREYNGVPIVKSLETMAPLTDVNDVCVGDTVYVPAFTLNGYHEMIVERGDGEDEYYARAGSVLAILEYGADDRNAWVSVGIVNTCGVTKLSMERPGDP